MAVTDAAPILISIPGGWGTIIVAVITGIVGPLLVVIVGAKLNRKVNHLRDDTKATRSQVENSHSTNLRDDQDDKHNELVELVQSVLGTQKSQRRDIGGMREDIRGVRTDLTTLRGELVVERERIRDLEQTQPNSPRPRKPRTRRSNDDSEN